MRGGAKFKLGVFAANADGGLAFTRVPERWRAQWDDVLAVAQLADRAGLDFYLPIARWLGFGGDTQPRLHSFETLTSAAAIGAATEQIAVFATVHTPFVHPVFAAKALATVDQASHGRAGLNVVCGWNEPEYALFGVDKLDDVYRLGYEWFEILSRILAGEGPFDFDGEFYQLRGVIGRPLSVQQPRPVSISAAFSPRGRDFAVRTSDALLTTFVDFESAAGHVEDIRSRAAAVGRELDIYTTCHIVCRESQAEAEAYYERYAVTECDDAAVDNNMRMKKEMSGSHDPIAYEIHRKRFAGGNGTYPLIGTPERIVEEMVRIAEVGYAGTTLSFVNFLDELPLVAERVLPLMREAGLREPRG